MFNLNTRCRYIATGQSTNLCASAIHNKRSPATIKKKDTTRLFCGAAQGPSHWPTHYHSIFQLFDVTDDQRFAVYSRAQIPPATEQPSRPFAWPPCSIKKSPVITHVTFRHLE